MKKTIIKFNTEYNAFCINDEEVQHMSAKTVSQEDITKLGGSLSPDKPVIGFLMGREEGCYAADINYVKSIILSGGDVRLISYENVTEQLKDVDAVVLPGGVFSSPDEFYYDGKKEYKPNKRYQAYETIIKEAEKRNLPLLGICAGAQMIGAYYGLELVRDVKTITGTEHKTKARDAHRINIVSGSPLADMFSASSVIVNSRHRECVNPHSKSEALRFYAFAEDGIPEAWGNERILCVQWHPEDFVIEGDKEMKKIYEWVVQQA